MDTIDIIITLLKEKRISGAKMSRDLGFSSGLFSQWKNRIQKPSIEKLQKVAEYFGVSVDDLLYDKSGILANDTISMEPKIKEIADSIYDDLLPDMNISNMGEKEILEILADIFVLPDDDRKSLIDYLKFLRNKK